MWTPEDVITTDRFLSLQSPGRIEYHKMDVFYEKPPITWRDKPHTIRPAPVWITGHSDFSLTDRILSSYGHLTGRWASVNADVSDPKVISLPSGITNDTDESPVHRIFGNVEAMYEVSRSPRTIRGLAYANFSPGTFPSVRVPLLEQVSGLRWVTLGTPDLTATGRRRFLEETRAHKFSFCPRGNGIDTHRLWETLYVGSIPIVVRHRALQEFEDLPICWVSDFAEATQEFLEEEFVRITSRTDWCMDKLKFSYWKARLTAPP